MPSRTAAAAKTYWLDACDAVDGRAVTRLSSRCRFFEHPAEILATFGDIPTRRSGTAQVDCRGWTRLAAFLRSLELDAPATLGFAVACVVAFVADWVRPGTKTNLASPPWSHFRATAWYQLFSHAVCAARDASSSRSLVAVADGRRLSVGRDCSRRA